MKKLFLSVLSAAMAISCLQSPLTLKAAKTQGDINVNVTANSVTIGNEYIEREISIKDNKVLTTSITNKRGNKDLVFNPAPGSEEFKIRLTKKAAGEQEKEPIALEAINRSTWTADADSYQNAQLGAGDGPAANLIDGNNSTIWHSRYGNGKGSKGDTSLPHNVMIRLGKEETFKSFSYTPRQEGPETNGNIKKYKFYISNKDSETPLAADDASWELVKEGSMNYEDVNPYYVNLGKAYTAKHVRLEAISSQNGGNFAGGAEFNLHKEEAPTASIAKNEREFFASDLTLKGAPVVDNNAVATINNQEKVGKKVTLNFEPYTFKGVTYTISENFVMFQGDHFMRKYLEISVPKADAGKAEIDYIDLESLNVTSDVPQWTIPTDAGGVVSMNTFHANLGQPIYIDGMFFGCEFPETDTQIVDGTGYMRYYTGKTFNQLAEDHQADVNKEGTEVHYQTWQTVAGAARSTDNSIIQSDFFDYIDSISTPSEFRIQYNSWFDNMMRIDDQNILESFIEIDKELNKTETRPMDSYVVDDGWNNYNDGRIVDATRSGTTLNQTGFWEFNNKFPDGLTPSSQLVQKFGSNFGVWVGPRGGYNFYNDLANILTKNGTGSKAGGSIDVADRVYVDKFQEMAIKWQQDYKVNYWKWDGFADGGQFNQWPATNGVASRAHNHMVGGYQHMYHVTDLWEAWIDLFEAVRVSEKEDDINKLWISLTCYVNPSPWFLQWGNSVWMQCVGDRGESGTLGGKMDKMLTYRDSMYYDFIKRHEFQFPLKAIYNHDPIYGKEGTGINVNSMTDEEFKNYLYIQGGRGTGFWELYYSDSLMTQGKYEANAEYLEWAEENFHMLKNAKWIGGWPAANVTLSSGPSSVGNGGDAYAYSGWDGESGIISMRNSATTNKTLTFTLDETIGVASSAKGKPIYRTTEHSYKVGADDATENKVLEFGQTVSVTLKPGEVRIWNLSTTKDETAPTIKRVFTDGDQTIGIRFDEKVSGNKFLVDGKEVTAKQSVDDITYYITLTTPMRDGREFTVETKDIKDLSGNAVANKKVTSTFHKGNVVLDKEANAETSVSKALNTNYGFTVYAEAENNTAKSLAKQANGYDLGINDQGKAYFTVNGATAVSDVVLTNAKHTITGVRENNGMLKLYVDGVLAGSKYLEANRYFDVTGNETVVAANTVVKVFDTGYGYDEVAKFGEVAQRTPIDLANATVTVSGTSEKNASNAEIKDIITDNNPETFWTSNAVSKIEAGNPYLQVDLGKNYKLDRVDYTPRYYNGAQNYWHCTGNIKKLVLEVSKDGENWTTVTPTGGADLTDKVVNENDRTLFPHAIEFEATEARYVRVSGLESYHWQENEVNKVITVGDLAVYGMATENVAKNKPVTGKWTETNQPATINSDRPYAMVTDGVKNNCDANHAGFGEDNKTDSAYVEVDLQSIYDLTSLNLYRYWNDNRTYKGTVIALSTTADFKNPTIIYNSDKENFHKMGAGNDELYVEKAAGKQFVFDTVIPARYIRVYMHGSNKGNTNHIVELEAYGFTTGQVEPEQPQADKTALTDLVKVAESKDLTRYTEQTATALVNAITRAKDVVADPKASEETVVAMVTELQAAIDGLKEIAIKPVAMSATLTDTIAMNVYLTVSEELLTDTGAYVKFSVLDGKNKIKKEIPVKDLVKVNDQYLASMPLYARQMSDTVTMEVFTTKANGEVTLDLTKEYSIKAYGDKVLASETSTQLEKEAVEGMLNYGAMAQVYFKYNVKNLANANVTNKDFETITAQSLNEYAAVITENNVKGATYGATNLRLLSGTAIRHHFIVDANEKDNLEFYVVNGETQTKVNPVYYDGNKAYVEINNVYAEDLNKAYTVKVVNTTEADKETVVTYSVFSYAKAILEKENASEDMKNVVKAMVDYNRKAIAYKDSAIH